ncbi:hypothetical protein M9H77_22639 [Catharanthus roseus]|uniref:Uncharacterized protein n=1 Tax=Catharanthus roseus TaxID=4058 RepID=A0ACC0AV36_CATRO|nr:hypothetical protein M9H77_22639 [Catharanthus roseus]
MPSAFIDLNDSFISLVGKLRSQLGSNSVFRASNPIDCIIEVPKFSPQNRFLKASQSDRKARLDAFPLELCLTLIIIALFQDMLPRVFTRFCYGQLELLSFFLIELCLVEYEILKYHHLSWLLLQSTLLSVHFKASDNGVRPVNGTTITQKINFCE